MTARRLKILIIAEAANPEWVSVPLIGWSHSRALAKAVDALVVTQVRNKASLERAGLQGERDFVALDTEAIGAPLYKASQWIRRTTGTGWTLSTATSVVPYYYFEYLLWRRFGAEIRSGRFDVVHRLTPLSPTTPSMIAGKCRRAGVPFVWGPVNGGTPWPRDFANVRRAEGEWLSRFRDAHRLLPGYRDTRRSASALIAGSVAVWDQFREDHERCVYVPENAVEPARFEGMCTPWRGGPLRVTFVGRLVPYKGADMLIEATAELVRAGKIVIDILGDGPEMPRLRELVTTSGVGDGVRLHGWVQHERVRDLLKQGHVLALPSVREFGGGVVLEGMMLGLVPLVVGYGGPNELVSDRTGVRVPLGPRPSIVAGIRTALERLLEDSDGLERMSANARRRVEQQFTWDAKAAQILEIYRWVLGQRDKPDFGMPFPD